MSSDTTHLNGVSGQVSSPARERFMGIALICTAFLCFAGLDTTAKYLVRDLPSVQVVWFRFASHVVLAFILFRVWQKPEYFRSKRWGLQIIRAFCLLGSTFFNFIAVRYLQLAETVSIMFAAPFVVTALAGPLLNEWAGPRRWAAIVVGFLGMLVVVRPGLGGMHWAAVFSVAAMICFSLYALLTRKLSDTESSVGMLIISGLVAALAMTPFAVDQWVAPPDLFSWALLISTGVYGGLGHFVLIVAHRLAPAPVLAPFQYSQIVWMIACGYIFFADVPGIWTVVGASIIVASGLYILYRERGLSN